MVYAQQDTVIVTLVPDPSPVTTFGDVIVGALGITGVLVLAAAVLGAVMAVVLVRWNRRHPPEEQVERIR